MVYKCKFCKRPIKTDKQTEQMMVLMEMPEFSGAHQGCLDAPIPPTQLLNGEKTV